MRGAFGTAIVDRMTQRAFPLGGGSSATPISLLFPQVAAPREAEYAALRAFREALRAFGEKQTVAAFRELQRAGCVLDDVRAGQDMDAGHAA